MMMKMIYYNLICFAANSTIFLKLQQKLTYLWNGMYDNFSSSPVGLNVGECLHHLRKWKWSLWIHNWLHFPTLYIRIQLLQRLAIARHHESKSRRHNRPGQGDHTASLFHHLHCLVTLTFHSKRKFWLDGEYNPQYYKEQWTLQENIN